MTVSLCRWVFAQSVQKFLHCTTIILFLWYSYSQIKCLYVYQCDSVSISGSSSINLWKPRLSLYSYKQSCPGVHKVRVEPATRSAVATWFIQLIYFTVHTIHYIISYYILLFCFTDLAQCEVICARLVHYRGAFGKSMNPWTILYKWHIFKSFLLSESGGMFKVCSMSL